MKDKNSITPSKAFSVWFYFNNNKTNTIRGANKGTSVAAGHSSTTACSKPFVISLIGDQSDSTLERRGVV